MVELLPNNCKALGSVLNSKGKNKEKNNKKSWGWGRYFSVTALVNTARNFFCMCMHKYIFHSDKNSSLAEKNCAKKHGPYWDL